jgi:hypothetical protein
VADDGTEVSGEDGVVGGDLLIPWGDTGALSRPRRVIAPAIG